MRDEWLPIETAPKDGTWIVVTSTWNKYARACVQYQDAAFCYDSDKSADMGLYTHWQPLPPPPVLDKTT